MAALQHAAEHPVGIVAAVVGTFAVFVIDPGQDDGFARRVVAEEQAVLLKEFGAEPVFVFVTERAPLAVFWPRGVLRDGVKGQFDDGRQPFGGVLFDVARWVFLLEHRHLVGQGIQLRQEQRVGKYRPAVNDQGPGQARAHEALDDA